MAYSRDLRKAAERHLAAADRLHPHEAIDRCGPQDSPDVAGYLYGLAAEIALKAMMWSLGMREQESRVDDPYFQHFPALKTHLRDHLLGRHLSALCEFTGDHFMSGWDIRMRYSATSEVRAQPIDTWKRDAHRAVRRMREVSYA